MNRLLVLFLLLLSNNSFSQKIGFNYEIKNNEVVFKLVLKPHQHIIIEYLNKYYGEEKLEFYNTDSVEDILLDKAYIDCETMFHLGVIYADTNFTKYDYNITGIYGDSILIDCTSRPYKIYAERISLGQLYLTMDSLIISRVNGNAKPVIDQDCDSARCLKLQNSVSRKLKFADDSVTIYTRYFSEFKKSVGYREALQMQIYSKAFQELFRDITSDKKPDSCYFNTIQKFETQLQYLLSYSHIIISSKENYVALYGYILYEVYKAKKPYSTENAFDIIDSLAKGDYNINCKMIFLNAEKNSTAKAKYLQEVINENEDDSTLHSYLVNMKEKMVLSIPFYNDSLFINSSNKAFSVKLATGKSDKKIYLLDFWASWCKPCVEEFNYVKALPEKISDKNFSIIYISIDDNIINWTKAEKKYHLPFNCSYVLSTSFKKDFMDKLEMKTIPRFILIDSTGKILNYETPRADDKELESIIKNYLKD
ncbi:MAG: redoxin family protein [Bacteroidota bacterium]|nr:redoxin family protein [Bacteroidota bacterium]